jgi:broad specificity phosphatase PhoE
VILVVVHAELIDPSHLTHVIVSPRLRAQRTAELLFSGVSDEDKSKMDWKTTEDVGEWKYGEYEGMHVSALSSQHGFEPEGLMVDRLCHAF